MKQLFFIGGKCSALVEIVQNLVFENSPVATAPIGHGLDGQVLVSDRMVEAQHGRMKPDGGIWERTLIAIFQIAKDGATYGCQLHPYLMMPSGI